MKIYIYYIFLIIIILVFSYINSLESTEEFTPTINSVYRPIVRNTRILSEGFYNKTTNNISNLFRKFGIL
jgi:hypothetical protein